MTRADEFPIVLRPADASDAAAILIVAERQDVGWWGVSETDDDEIEVSFFRVRQACGSLADGARIATVDGSVVGFAGHVGHGDTDLFVDPTHEAATSVRLALVRWLVESGAETLDGPEIDKARLADFATVGFRPSRSSFDMERSIDLSDVVRPPWPAGTLCSDFDVDRDGLEVHTMLYDFWTDVPGHRYRPFEEWRSLFMRVDPNMVVTARDVDGAVVGVAVTQLFFDGMGWVAQLGVARSARGRGLGRALLIKAFDRLVAAGAQRLGLSVEAVNDGALGLYRGAGLEVDREWVHCTATGDVAAAPS
jgi:ribosomal protein S18 acetylase RimI-like enzyme